MKKYSLLCLAAFTLVMAGSIAGCSGGSQSSTAEKVEISELRDEAVLPDTEGADIEVLSLENPIDYCYSSAEADMIFKKKDGVWLDAMDTAIPLNQDKFEAMAENFLRLHAVTKLDNPGSMSEYGLDNPSYSLYITDSERGEIDIAIGSQTGDGTYYATVNEGDVYTIKAATVESMVFDYDTLVVRDTLELSVTAGDIQKASVTAGGKTTSYKTSDTEVMTGIAEGINAIEPVDYASYHVLSQELTAAELTEEERTTFQAEITVDGQTKALTIYVGTYANPDESLRYIQLDGSSMIMIVDNEAIKKLLNEQEEAE